jgi:hypothetical protein
MENSDEPMPISIQKNRKRVLEIFSAIKGPISKDTTVAAGSSQKSGCSWAMNNNVKNHVVALKIRKKIKKNCPR